jgi:hypothetical protein
MEISFSLYFPFQLPASRGINNLPYTSTLAGNAAELKPNPPHVAVVVRGIPTEEDTRLLFDRLSDAMYWMALDIGVGVTFSRELGQVYRPEDPTEAAKNIEATTGLKRERVDVIVDGGQPHVTLDRERPLTMTLQPANFQLSHSPEAFVRSLDNGLDVVRSAGAIPPRLRLACEVYSQTHFLSSGFARFQALFIPLEVAAPESAFVHEAALAQVRQWQKDLRTVIESTAADDPTRRELKVLESRLGQLGRQSHTTRIRDFVQKMLEGGGHEDADKQALAIVRLYGNRGALAHEGADGVGEDVPELEQIVRRTLMAAWLQRSRGLRITDAGWARRNHRRRSFDEGARFLTMGRRLLRAVGRHQGAVRLR